MQISRHWRLNAQRYRLEGFRNIAGEVSLQSRPVQQGGVSPEINDVTNKKPIDQIKQVSQVRPGV